MPDAPRQKHPQPDSTLPTGGASVLLENVTRRYHAAGQQPLTAVDDVTLNIDAGAVVAVTGPSGSGKSTLLHLIGAIDQPDYGHVRVNGTDLSTLSRRQLADYRRGLGFVFQRFNLLPALTVIDNITAPVLPYRVPYSKQERAHDLLAAVGLAGRETTLPSRLSGGEQQRVAIARALINQPPLLLADEPTGNLDSTTGSRIVDMLLRLGERYGMTIVFATHDPAIAARADRYLRLRDGRITDDQTITAGKPPDTLAEQIDRLRS
jgi:putative ABC transport system ATP-binding protein